MQNEYHWDGNGKGNKGRGNGQGRGGNNQNRNRGNGNGGREWLDVLMALLIGIGLLLTTVEPTRQVGGLLMLAGGLVLGADFIYRNRRRR